MAILYNTHPRNHCTKLHHSRCQVQLGNCEDAKKVAALRTAQHCWKFVHGNGMTIGDTIGKPINKWGSDRKTMGKMEVYPPVICYIAIENDHL